jgi:hypothetical protein
MDNELVTVNNGCESKFDRLFSVLGDQRCRYALYSLHEAPTDIVMIDEIAPTIADWETGPEAEPTGDQLEKIKITLHHRVLPKLEAYGIIDFDPRSKTIRYWNDTPMEPWLEQVKRQEISAREQAKN